MKEKSGTGNEKGRAYSYRLCGIACSSDMPSFTSSAWIPCNKSVYKSRHGADLLTCR